MKKLYCLSLICFLAINTTYSQCIDISHKIDTLKKIELIPENANVFISFFPDNYYEFHNIFVKPEDPFFNFRNSKKQIIFFFKECKNIDEKEFYEKIIRISVGNSWKADCTTLLQIEIKKELIKNTKEIVDVLKLKSNAIVRAFFYFVFDDMTLSSVNIPRELILIEQYDKRIYRILNSTIENIRTDIIPSDKP